MKMRAQDVAVFIRSLVKWRRNKLARLSEWQFTPSYWKLNQKWQGALFRSRRLIYQARFRARTTNESLSALRNLFTSIIKPILLAVSLFSFLELIEFILREYGPGLGLNNLSTAVPRHTILFLRQHIHRNFAAYTSALSTSMQVAGVFLGLYFAAVSVVVSTVYARVQGDVRSLLMRDKIGNRYIAIVALLGAMSTLLLGAMGLGYRPGVLNFVFVIGMGEIAVYSFVVLGLRIFYFFDPTRLVDYLTKDLVRWIGEATPKGHWWQDASFQSNYQRQAQEILTTYRNIVYLANREEHLQSRALVGLAARAFHLLQYYAQQKLSIPTDSKWFRRTYKHVEWLTASDSVARVALASDTAIRSEEVPDLMWVEDEIEGAVAYSLKGLFERKDLSSAYSFSGSAQQAFGSMARRFAVDEALHLFHVLSPLISDQILKIKVDVVDLGGEFNELQVALGLTDIYGLGFISILLGLSESLSETTAGSLAQIVTQIRWGKPKSIYTTRLPRSVVEQIEALRVKLEFERSVERRVLTPSWYQQHLVALSFVRFIESSVKDLVNDLERVFAVQVESLLSARRHIFAAQLIERGLEACNKFAYHFETAKACAEDLATLRSMQDIPWPAIDWEDYDKRITSVRDRLVTAFSQTLPTLAKLPRSTRMPDYFGHAYSVAADQCYFAMASGKEALFSTLFPSFFNAAIAAHERLRTSPEINNPRFRAGMIAQPLIEMLEISGYAIIYTELDGKSFWPQAKIVWDSYLNEVPDGKATANYFLMSLDLKQSIFGMFPRDVIQTTWRQDLSRRLRERGLLTKRYPLYDSTNEHQQEHPSPIIRALAHGMMLFTNAYEVFIAVYLMELFPREELSNVRRVDSYYGSLQRETKRKKGVE